MSNKQKNVTVITPAGIAVYPWLHQPDTKFNPDGEYRTKLRLSAEDAAGVIAKAEEVLAEHIAKVTKETKKKPKVADRPWTEVIDDQGNATGELEFSFKRKAKVKLKDGKVFDAKVDVVDTKKNPLPAGTSVFGGSTIKVAAEVVPYFTPLLGAGVSLRLKAVQVLNLVSGSGGGAGNLFDEEDGYEAAASGDSFGGSEDDDEDF